ncbi:MAG TPA: hypothetical protein VFY39_07440 [Gammaproteobacteria bacterium]|nr:hypothetical protein [Gammaproteobacteria bacterium]
MNDFDTTAATRQQASPQIPSSSASRTHASVAPGGNELPATLKADCSRCAGLCCIVPAFYAVQGFGFDKPAHTPCLHLTGAGRCTIHAELSSRGFSGCRAFDCYGAGQRVTQEIFPGISWRASDEAAADIFSAYTCLFALHRLMALLATAEAALPPPFTSQMSSMRRQLDELCRAKGRSPASLDLGRLERETMSSIREAYKRATER